MIAAAECVISALVRVVTYSFRTQQCDEASPMLRREARRRDRDALQRTRRRGQKRGHAEFCGEPTPEEVILGELVLVRSPAPPVPANRSVVDRHIRNVPVPMLNIAD